MFLSFLTEFKYFISVSFTMWYKGFHNLKRMPPSAEHVLTASYLSSGLCENGKQTKHTNKIVFIETK